MWPLGTSQPFDGRDVLAGHRPERRIAGGYGAIVNHDVTGAAFAGATAEMWSDHAKLPAQDIQQRPIGISVDIRLDAIEAKSNTWHRGRTLADASLLRLVELFDDLCPFHNIAAQEFVELFRR